MSDTSLSGYVCAAIRIGNCVDDVSSWSWKNARRQSLQKSATFSMRLPMNFIWCGRRLLLKARQVYWRRLEANIAKKPESPPNCTVFLCFFFWSKFFDIRCLLRRKFNVGFTGTSQLFLLFLFYYSRSIFKPLNKVRSYPFRWSPSSCAHRTYQAIKHTHQSEHSRLLSHQPDQRP